MKIIFLILGFTAAWVFIVAVGIYATVKSWEKIYGPGRDE